MYIAKKMKSYAVASILALLLFLVGLNIEFLSMGMFRNSGSFEVSGNLVQLKPINAKILNRVVTRWQMWKAEGYTLQTV